MKANFLISILIPCFNSFESIHNCIKSCINQTYKNIEIILIDDGSTDDTYSLMEIYKKKDNRIKVFKQKNMGVSHTRNRLISLSNGYYLFFLDSDDSLPHDSIEKLFNNSDNGKMDIVIGKTKNILNLGNKFKIVAPFIPTIMNKGDNKFNFVKSNMCLLWGFIFKKSFFNSLNIKFDNDLNYFEDISIATYIFLKSNNFRQINEYCYEYNRNINNTNNMSSFKINHITKLNDFYKAFDILLNLFKNENWNLDVKMSRFINGAFFPILVGFDLLITNFTKNIIFRSILRRKMILLFNNYNFHLEPSKTWWKFFLYIYIYNNFITYTKLNKIKRITFFNKKQIKNFNYDATFIKGMIKNNYIYNLKKTIIIGDLNFLKNNMNIINNKDVFFILKIIKKYEIEKINNFILDNKINIFGYSIYPELSIDVNKINLNSFAFLNYDVRHMKDDKILDFLSKINLENKFITISLIVNKNFIKIIKDMNFKYDFLFVEE